jgi:hypothetical protein
MTQKLPSAALAENTSEFILDDLAMRSIGSI